MCRFIESIRYENGIMPLIALHQHRFEKTQAEVFGKIIHKPLKDIIYRKAGLHQNLNTGKYKCRVVYDAQNISIEFIAYHPSKIDRMEIVTGDQIDYHFKYEDRRCFKRLKSALPDGTEILIIKNNLVTDTSFTNVALFDGKKWFTPALPLLEGVQRDFLINEKIIFPEEIRLNDLHYFKKIKLFNAMINWEEAPVLDVPENNL